MSEYSVHKMNKEQRHSYVIRRAEELAQTGEHRDWLMIEHVLRAKENFPEAREWLDNRFLRDRLDDMCKRARENRTPNNPA